MLATLKSILNIAEENNYAIGSFNTPNLESLLAVVQGAEELKLPVIIQHAQSHEDLIPLSIIGPIMLKTAEQSSVPICVHLDHGTSLDVISQSLSLGFTSVMYDGSALPYEENLRNTLKVVEMASRTGASVEAELGVIGKKETGLVEKPQDEDTDYVYTDPDQAKAFVEETGIDALACAFGTVHGIYFRKPTLRFDIVEKVRQATGNIPVVMHGGSGLSREEYRQAINAGVRKINYFTYMNKAGAEACADYISKQDKSSPILFTHISDKARIAMMEHIKQAMKIFSLME